MKYSLWKAIAYEIVLQITEQFIFYRGNRLLRAIKDACFPDWIEWSTERTMQSVDHQIQEIQTEWSNAEKKPEFIQYPPDQSKAQELLGGAIEIKAPWIE